MAVSTDYARHAKDPGWLTILSFKVRASFNRCSRSNAGRTSDLYIMSKVV